MGLVDVDNSEHDEGGLYADFVVNVLSNLATSVRRWSKFIFFRILNPNPRNAPAAPARLSGARLEIVTRLLNSSTDLDFVFFSRLSKQPWPLKAMSAR